MWKLKFRAETPQHEKTATTTKVFLCLFERIRKKLIQLSAFTKQIHFQITLCVECASFCYFTGIFRLCFAKWRVFNRLILRQKVTLRIVDRGAEVFNSLSIKVSRLCSHRIQTWDSSLNWNTVLIYTDNKTHFKTFPMFFSFWKAI